MTANYAISFLRILNFTGITHIGIFVPRSKTDVYREGNYVFISAFRSKYCPVGVLQRYLDLSGIDLCSSLRPLVFHR